MYDVRSRRGLRQTQQKSETGNKRYQTKLESSKSSFRRKDNLSSKESESDDSVEDSPEQYKKISRIYPKLPKEDELDDKNEERTIEEKYPKLKRQTIEKKYPRIQEESSSSRAMNYITLSIISLVILLIAYFYIIHPAGNINIASCKTPMCLFQNQYKSMRDTFVSQEKFSWKVIGSAVISVVNKTTPTQPAVVLLVSNKDAKVISSCIANYLASSVELSYGNPPDYPKIQNKQFFSATKMKENIYTTFKKSFDEENHHVIVLEDLDTFSAETAMALHFFCDHENAPYKDIVIILTAIVDDAYIEKELRPRDMDSIARKHLDQMWNNELEKEKRAALLSRITSSVAVIRTEKNIPNICHN